MSNPFRATNTCDIYWDISHPVPDVANVPCTLVPAWEDGQIHGVRNVPALMYTHILHLEPNVDIRDRYIGAMAVDAVNTPCLFVPSGGNTLYYISFVERVNRGQRADHKIAYIDRHPAPNWPNDDV
jgi:hypothetical protein